MPELHLARAFKSMLEMVGARIHFTHSPYARSDLTVTPAPYPGPLVPTRSAINNHPGAQTHIQVTPPCTAEALFAFKSRRENESAETLRSVSGPGNDSIPTGHL